MKDLIWIVTVLIASNCIASAVEQNEPRSLFANGEKNPDCPLTDNPFEPTLLPYPGACDKFYKCSYGKSYVLTCPYGLHWDTQANYCESPFIAQCSQGDGTTRSTLPTTRTTPTTPTTLPTTRSTEKLDPNLPFPTPECSDVTSIRKYGIPGECKKYVQCNQGNAYILHCRVGREWSVRYNDCIDATLAGCSTTFVTTQPTVITTKSTTITPTSCTEGVEFLSHPTDCHMFLQCDNGKPVEINCPEPLYWDKITKRCQWSSANCR